MKQLPGFKLRTLAPAIAIAVAGYSPLASASMLEEVVVTAQKRAQDAQDISISVSAYSGAQLNAMGVTSAKDLADLTAGVQINMEYGNAPTFTIRGINVNDFGVGTSPAAAVYVDGIYKASNINSGAQLFDIERVEILKGPQGTLWGKNTTGGAVSIVTNKPSQETEGFFQAGIGNNSRLETEAALGGALTDTLSARLSVQSITADGPFNTKTFKGQPVPGSEPIDATTDSRIQYKGKVDGDPGDMDIAAARLELLWELDGIDILAIGHYARDRGENHPTTSVLDPDPEDDKVSNEFVYTRDTKFYGGSIQLNIDIGDKAQLVSISGYDYFDRNGGLDTMGDEGIAAQSQFTQIYLTEFDQYSQELRYEVQGDNYFWLVGGFYADSEINQNDNDHYSIGFFTAPFNYRYKHKNTDAAVFAHGEYDFSDAFKVTAGLRYSDEERKQPFYKLWFGPGLGPDLPGGSIDNPVDGEFDFVTADNTLPGAPDQTFETDGWSYKLGLDWTPSDNMLLYYSFSKGLKSGGFRSDAATSLGELTAFDDETLYSNEIGMKWDPSDNLRLNASVFYYDYQDVQQKVPTVIPPFGELNTMTNLDSADVLGLELETIYRPTEGLELGLNASFLDTEINDDSVINGKPIDGNDLPFAPDVAASGFARYETTLSDNLMGSIQLSVNYTGDHYTNVSGDDALFGSQNYTTVGFNAAIWNEAKGWELSIYGKNLTDEIYWTNTFSAVGGFISEPGSYGARLRIDF